MKPSQADAYWSGYRAASAGRKRSAPSTLNFEMMHWWLGGYSDWEIETKLTPANQVHKVTTINQGERNENQQIKARTGPHHQREWRVV